MITDPHIEKKIRIADIEVPIWFYGNPKNPPILFIHGRFHGFSEYIGDLPPRYLSKNYYICAFDLPGFGKSKKIKITHLEFLNRIVNEFFTGKVVLFGASYGGLIALDFAKENSDKTKALIVAATPIYSGLLSLIYLVKIIPFLNTKASFVQDFKFLTIKNLSQIKIPTLLIYSTKDVLAPVSMGKKINKLIPNSKLVVIHTRIHRMFLHRIDETGILAEIDQFLSSLSI